MPAFIPLGVKDEASGADTCVAVVMVAFVDEAGFVDIGVVVE